MGNIPSGSLGSGGVVVTTSIMAVMTLIWLKKLWTHEIGKGENIGVEDEEWHVCWKIIAVSTIGRRLLTLFSLSVCHKICEMWWSLGRYTDCGIYVRSSFQLASNQRIVTMIQSSILRQPRRIERSEASISSMRQQSNNHQLMPSDLLPKYESDHRPTNVLLAGLAQEVSE